MINDAVINACKPEHVSLLALLTLFFVFMSVSVWERASELVHPLWILSQACKGLTQILSIALSAFTR